MLPVKFRGGLATWDPFSEARRVHDEMDRIFGSFWGKKSADDLLPSAWRPAIDVIEEKDDVVVKADLPGVQKEDVTLSVTDDLLTIKGERKTEREDKGDHFYIREGSYGQFIRTIQLPVAVKAEKAKADYKSGVLRVTLPKAEEAKRHNITIDVK